MSYTCIACRVAFRTPDLQRSHYRTDWHRYNLKRKVAELPPVSAEVFQEKVLAQRGGRESEEAANKYCKACSKRFSSSNAYTNHLKSKKHRENELRLAKDQEDAEKHEKETAEKKPVDEVEDDEEVVECEEDEPLEVTECLFCEHCSVNVEDNVKHMARSHSFFIPEVEFLVGLKGLIGYLGAKVGMGHVCVWCNRSFSCVEAVRHHMVDKGHTFMLYDDTCRDEYAEFYDFRSSYPDYDPQKQPKDKTGNEGGSDGEEDEELPMEVVACDESLGELVLPSGARAGHRALWRYYRQKLPPERQQLQRSRIQRVIAQYQAVGWTGSVEVQRRAKEKQRMEQATHARFELRDRQQLSMKANKLQKHFRSQNFLW